MSLEQLFDLNDCVSFVPIRFIEISCRASTNRATTNENGVGGFDSRDDGGTETRLVYLRVFFTCHRVSSLVIVERISPLFFTSTALLCPGFA